MTKPNKATQSISESNLDLIEQKENIEVLQIEDLRDFLG